MLKIMEAMEILKLELNAHSGWDSVSMSQDNMYILRFKAGSLAGMATNAFRGSAIAYDYGPSTCSNYKS
jgi:hypothetical protein